MFLFLLLLSLGYWGLTDGLDNFGWLHLISTTDIVLISLATFRLIRLVTYDKIFAFARNLFLDRTEDGSYIKTEGGFRRTVSELVECLWCTGLWAAPIATCLYFVNDAGRFVVIILAIAAVGSFMQVFSKMIGRLGSH